MKEFQVISINGVSAIQRYDGAHYGTGEKVFFVTFCRTPDILEKTRKKYISMGYIEK